MIDTYDKFWDAVHKIEKSIKNCVTIEQIDNCKQWMDNVWNNNLSKFRCIGTNLQDMVEIKQLLNTAYSTQRQIILNNQNFKDNKLYC